MSYLIIIIISKFPPLWNNKNQNPKPSHPQQILPNNNPSISLLKLVVNHRPISQPIIKWLTILIHETYTKNFINQETWEDIYTSKKVDRFIQIKIFKNKELIDRFIQIKIFKKVVAGNWGSILLQQIRSHVQFMMQSEV